MSTLAQKNVVVTGASAGVGRAIAREFGRQQANVALLARDPDRLQQAADEIHRLGGQAMAIPTDVADADQVESAADQFERRFGPPDVWVNCAMSTVFSPFHQLTPDEYRRATDVTYLGTVYGTMAAIKRMRPRNSGAIVQVGSALAYRAIPLQAPYCGAKHAVRGFTDSVRCELMHENSRIHITSVHLPAVNTPQFSWCKTRLSNHPQPVPPIFQPEVAAEAVVWAAQHRRREILVGSSAVKAVWGNKFFPGLADRYLARTGFDAQQTDQPIDPQQRPSNLFDSVPGNYAAHGIFDNLAKSHSWQLWATTHRRPLSAVAGILVVTALAAYTQMSSNKRAASIDLSASSRFPPKHRATQMAVTARQLGSDGFRKLRKVIQILRPSGAGSLKGS